MSSSTKDKEVCDGNKGGNGVGVRCCLSGNKDFFDVILSKSHITTLPYYLHPPTHILPKLPGAKVPLALRHGDKQWQMMYHGNDSRPRFECAGWKKFVNDNNLAEGDACIFEVMESSPQIHKTRHQLTNLINRVEKSRKHKQATVQTLICKA
ncbi:B3 domain-containing protein Os04g0386900-like [Salvia splendens]|uniref:B3 domain-containing protein Os04g0386900-like n=1 Tax=Salvia splendens TaxID=180675 RepID=UPI001C2763E4|nr:B3 domain-containing protein Os04g0386900-like [Salvia splendens]